MYISTKTLFEVGPDFILTLALWQSFWLSDFFFFCLCSAHLKSRNKLENICQILYLLTSSTSGAGSGKEEKHSQE